MHTVKLQIEDSIYTNVMFLLTNLILVLTKGDIINMSHDAEKNGFTPQWHIDELNKREESIKNGAATFSDLEEAKLRLQKLV